MLKGRIMMKKTIPAVLLLCLMLFPMFAVASPRTQEVTHDNPPAELTECLRGQRQSLLKTHSGLLRQLGYPEEMLQFLGPDELVSIVEHGYKFLSAESRHDLYISYENTESSDDSLTLVVPLTVEELRAYNNDMHGFIEKNAASLDMLFRFKEQNHLGVLSCEGGEMGTSLTLRSTSTTYTAIDF
jgi:hypothetical protein